MANLETKYLGLTLKNPIIVASSGFTKNIDKLVECEKAGAGAVVLKSLFEEVLLRDSWGIERSAQDHTEAYEYISGELELQYGLVEYCKFIKEAKERVNIPIIASVNCMGEKHWVDFAVKLQDAGADALELNVFSVPFDQKITGVAVEQEYYELLAKVKEVVTIPVSLKIGKNFSSLPNFVYNLYCRKIDGVVLFNRFTEPDIDINNLEINTTFNFSKKSDYHDALRWIAVLSHDLETVDFSATTGIHTSEEIIKMLLVGASTVQMASVFYQNGVGIIKDFLADIENWMEKHKFNSIEDFKGKLTFEHVENPKKYLRAQFLEKIRNVE